MNISIIIPTYNNARVLGKTLNNFTKIRPIDGLEIEILIVNNNSTDDTNNILEQYSKKLPIKAFFQPQQGTSIAKNTGISNSTGELIVFTDDDVRPEINWINIYWEAYRKNSERYFWGGRIISEYESNPPCDKLLKYAPLSVSGLSYGEQERPINQDEYFIGANWACPRKSLEDVGMFDIKLGLNPSQNTVMVGEETELMFRLKNKGYQGLYLPKSIVYHFVPTTKTKLKHIADRNEAGGFYAGSIYINKTKKHCPPKWVIRAFAEYFFKFKFFKLIGKDYKTDYIEFKKAKGFLRAVYNNRR